jgi:hypothetical protein
VRPSITAADPLLSVPERVPLPITSTLGKTVTSLVLALTSLTLSLIASVPTLDLSALTSAAETEYPAHTANKPHAIAVRKETAA